MDGRSRMGRLNITGQRILYYIRMHPGTHMRELGRELNLVNGVLQYHLQILEEERLVIFVKQRFYTFIYESGTFTDVEIRIMNNLAQKPTRDILLFLVKTPNANQSDVAEFIGCTRPTAAWHMARLINQGLVESKREGRTVTYHITCDKKELAKLIKVYYPSIFGKWADRLTDIVLSFDNE